MLPASVPLVIKVVDLISNEDSTHREGNCNGAHRESWRQAGDWGTILFGFLRNRTANCDYRLIYGVFCSVFLFFPQILKFEFKLVFD
jgi:hypothetical protein